MIRNIWELRSILKNKKMSPSDLEELREKKLRAVIRNAYDHVPYYRSLFHSAGLSPDDIRSVADLTKVPITSKEDVKAAGLEEMTADWVHRPSLVSSHTSGTTGEPLTVYRSEKEEITGSLLHFASLIAAGLRPSDRYAVYGPKLSIPAWLHRYFRIYKNRVIRQNLSWDEQISQLREFQPTVIRTYPSALRSLIHNLNHPLSEVVQPKIVILGAEIFDEALKHRVKAELDAEFLDNYGAVELGHLAWECPTHEGLHLNAAHFIFECLQTEQTRGLGEAGVTVVTSLFAFAMPFIRYELGDLCALLDRECSCGCAFPLMDHPIGRANDMVSLPSGKILSAMEFGKIVRGVPGVNQWQLVQETRDHLVLTLTMPEKPDEALIHRIRRQCLAYVEEPVSFDIRRVDYVDEGLKFRYVVSKVKPQET